MQMVRRNRDQLTIGGATTGSGQSQSAQNSANSAEQRRSIFESVYPDEFKGNKLQVGGGGKLFAPEASALVDRPIHFCWKSLSHEVAACFGICQGPMS